MKNDVDERTKPIPIYRETDPMEAAENKAANPVEETKTPAIPPVVSFADMGPFSSKISSVRGDEVRIDPSRHPVPLAYPDVSNHPFYHPGLHTTPHTHPHGNLRVKLDVPPPPPTVEDADVDERVKLQRQHTIVSLIAYAKLEADLAEMVTLAMEKSPFVPGFWYSFCFDCREAIYCERRGGENWRHRELQNPDHTARPTVTLSPQTLEIAMKLKVESEVIFPDQPDQPLQSIAPVPSLSDIAGDLGKLLEEKNAAYGSSIEKSGEYLRLLYPDGIRPDQYDDVCFLVRMFDKQMRTANKKDAFGENPMMDLAGYGILKVWADLKKKHQQSTQK